MRTDTSIDLNDYLDAAAKDREKLADQRRLEVAAMTDDERFQEFLRRCNRKGERYKPDSKPLPNASQLAKYCGCVTCTICRIAEGEIKSPSAKIMRILRAIACIDPRVPHDQITRERRERMRDADRWVEADPTSRGEIMEVILAGIDARKNVAWN